MHVVHYRAHRGHGRKHFFPLWGKLRLLSFLTHGSSPRLFSVISVRSVVKFFPGWGSVAPYWPIFSVISPSIFLSQREPREEAMRFGKTLTFLILAMALVYALPARAQQKLVAPGFSPILFT